MSDPNSKAGITEMLAIAKERDLAAMLIVHSPNQMEFEMHLNTSWSCAWVEPDEGKGIQLRVKSKLADYPSREEQQKAVEATVGMILSSTNVMQMWAGGFMDIGKLLAEKFESIEPRETQEEGKPLNLGATGKFPQGKIHPADEGELRMAIGIDKGKVILDFGKSVAFIGLDKQSALGFASLIIEKASLLP